ncbi:MAG: pilus (MSHA type) biogenesis protein MshL [Wolinella sp.]
MIKKAWIFAGIVAFFALNAEASICEKRVFTLSTKDSGVSAGEIVKQLAAECSYSVLLRDEVARARLKKNMPSVNIKQAPLRRIFDLILRENGLYYEFDGSILRISFLVTKTFKINYVGTDRSGVSNTEVSISRDDGASGSGNTTRSASGGANTGSSGTGRSGINIKAEDGFRFWEGIQAEILSILNRPGDSYALPQASSASSTNTRNASAPTANASSGSAGSHAGLSASQPGSVVVNRGAGLVTVTGTSEQIERVSQYIDALHERLQSQVMIDVSILTVRHSAGSTTGVDWNQLYNLQNVALLPKTGSSGSGSGSGSTSKIAPGEVQFGAESGALVLGVGGKRSSGYALNIFSQGVTLTRVVEFLKNYGEVSSVSNPKVLTLNNQPAMISVGNIIRYRKSTVFQTSGSSSTNTNTDTEYPSVFAGVLLDITPSIHGDEIMLKINPSITQTKGFDVDLAPTALETPPNLSTNQLSSLVRVKDGEKIILGGLISKSNHKNKNKVPLLGDIPLLGYFFSYSSDIESTDEMVLVITPHIIRGDQKPSLQDLGYSLMSGSPESKEKEGNQGEGLE